ncbi:MAG TPA: carboxypeptidase-like regulatory domain-containing protein, partial [Pirellulales bacterium]|nr:carboxypeptidase-like regulatory domain-containing protein [Pirellulales bacterium]
MNSPSRFIFGGLTMIGSFLVAVHSRISIADEAPEKTASMTISGHANGPDGKPLAGATINLCIGPFPNWKIVATAATGADGRFEFKDVRLPLSPSPMTHEKLPKSSFSLFGTAAGFGFAWSGSREYWDGEKPSDVGMIPGDKRARQGHVDFYRSEPIVIDLEFTRAAILGGKVVDEDSRPVSGAKVSLSDADYLNGDGKALNIHIRQFVAMREFLPRNEWEAQTDSDGRFEIGGLPAEVCFAVNIEHAGFAKSSFHAATTSRAISVHHYNNEGSSIRSGTQIEVARPGKHDVRTGEITVRLHPLHTVLIDVVEVDTGRPVVNASVSAVAPTRDGRSGFGKTDANGRTELKLAMGQYRVAADPPRGSLYIRSRATLDGIAGRDTEPFTIQVAKGCLVNFDVVDAESGEGVVGIGFQA